MMLTSELEDILAELRASLEAIYHDRLVHLLLYGSQVRGEAYDESDIDILVVLKGQVNPASEINRTGEIVSNLSLQYNTVISCVFMPEQIFQNEHSPLLLNIQREGLPI